MTFVLALCAALSSTDSYSNEFRSDRLAEHVDAVHRESKLCGPLTLCFCLRCMGLTVECREIIDQANVTAQGTSVERLVELARSFLPSASAIEFETGRIDDVPVPAILITEDVHCVAYCGVDEAGQFIIFEPTNRTVKPVSASWLSQKWNGKAIVFVRAEGLGLYDYLAILSSALALLLAVVGMAAGMASVPGRLEQES